MTHLLIFDKVEAIRSIRVDVVLEGGGSKLSVHHMTRLGRQVKKKRRSMQVSIVSTMASWISKLAEHTSHASYEETITYKLAIFSIEVL